MGEHSYVSGQSLNRLIEIIDEINVFASGKDGIFSPGTPIGVTNLDGEVELFVDPNQLSFVTVQLINISKDNF